jgi:DtxR family Mn-dependent transcriptional regulator
VPEPLSASLEDYMEAIYHVVEEKQAARPKDIASRLSVSSSSVTGALRALAARALINYAPYDVVTLTDEGRSVAQEIVRRHEALQEFFVKVLSVSDGLAAEAACEMEHAVPRELLERFIRFVDFVDMCPRGGAAFIDGFRRHCMLQCDGRECERCIEGCLEDLRAKQAWVRTFDTHGVALDKLDQGQRARVRSVGGSASLRERLAELGLAAGSVVNVERVAPGEAIDVKVQGYHRTVRWDDAREVVVEDLDLYESA